MATVETEIRMLSSDEIVAGGVPLATLRVRPEELTERTGINWSADGDELGDFQGAVFEAGPGSARYALLSYDASDPQEITLIGELESVEGLDEVLASLRVAESEVFDRIDHPAQTQVREAVSAPGMMVALEQALALVRARVDELQVESEMARLASLASIEEAELTPRQREVLERSVSGLSPEEVAEELGLSRATVLRHLRTLRNTLVHQR